ncbi:hypothetical protein H480_15431 [Amycolatopsis vancoresmycina DSM 44592]|uniref:Uncharacterized protein n=1 Tax=Amycolatopsis vancoresmycina DSM 44592 TaxID=1292037 RepID=R1I537_9PSEU|nr:hypothetical protein H480_15431 [Amycolatopsis vancoresmycina DSM 44592]
MKAVTPSGFAVRWKATSSSSTRPRPGCQVPSRNGASPSLADRPSSTSRSPARPAPARSRMPHGTAGSGSGSATTSGAPRTAVVHRAAPTSAGTRTTVASPGVAGPRRPNSRVPASQARPSTFSPPASGTSRPAAANCGRRARNQARKPSIGSAGRSPSRR